MESIILRSLDGLERVIDKVDPSRLGDLYVMPILRPMEVGSIQDLSLNSNYRITNRKYRFIGNWGNIGTQSVRIYNEEFEEINSPVTKTCTHNWTVYHGLTTVETICTLCNEKK